MREADPTPMERAFLAALQTRIPALQDWYHEDEDGTLWMLVSFDFEVGTVIRDTLRLDVDATSLAGGWSPSCLNWDDGVRARAANIDLSPPDGFSRDGYPDAEAAAAAAAWFEWHIENYPRPRAD